MANLNPHFISHGSPLLVIDEESPSHQFLKGLGSHFGKPKAAVIVSAHWETHVPAVTTSKTPETIHDFYGFPDELYDIVYPAPGAPDVAGRVKALLEAADIPCEDDPERGLDHGAWQFMHLMYPEADVPIVQLSVQPVSRSPMAHVALGEALAPLREEEILLVGSGSATHNLRQIIPPNAVPQPYTKAFEDWLVEHVEAGDADVLKRCEETAPHWLDNHPRNEHFLPFLVAMGAAGSNWEGKTLHRGIELANMSMAAFEFKPA